MKCEVCLQLLEEYLDGELKESEVAPVSAHLVSCAGCASEFEALTSEQEIYARYDRELNNSPAMWNEIATRTVELRRTPDRQQTATWLAWLRVPSLGWSFAGALAVLLLAVALGISYFRPSEPNKGDQQSTVKTTKATEPAAVDRREAPGPEAVALKDVPRAPKTPKLREVIKPDESTQKPADDPSDDVVFSADAYATLEEKETQAHIENAQNLLRSVRNIEITEDDSDIDVTYEKALSRRLLNENIVLRREAEMSGKFPTKTLLSDLEPFLIDIANLPDKPAADDLRVLKERVQKTEIVAALQGY